MQALPSSLFILPLAFLTSGCITGYLPTCDRVEEPAAVSRIQQGPLGDANAEAIPLFVRERAQYPHQTLWLAVVPGTSEQWGHHRAPPQGTLLSDEFQARLDKAYSLLEAGTVRFVLVSGGAVDSASPDYVEADRGKEYLLQTYGKKWGGGGDDLAARILQDPLAQHSTTNIRNADKLTVELGLRQNLIATTMPSGGGADAATQGFYFLNHDISSFDTSSESDFGYTLGQFVFYAATVSQGPQVDAIAHSCLSVDRLQADSYGP
jgi:hypothetical protein